MALKRMAVKAKTLRNSKSPTRIRFIGYTGDAVDLSDVKQHGLDHPVVYDLKTLRFAGDQIPLMYEHRTDVGHTTKINNSHKDVKGFAEITEENKAAKRILNSKGMEMSMGLDVENIILEFHPEGMRANGRKFTGPHYLIKNALCDEMTCTEAGRDGKTYMHFLSKSVLSEDELMKLRKRIDNSKGKKATPPQKSTARRVPNKKPKPTGARVINRVIKKTKVIKQGADRQELSRLMYLTEKFPDQAGFIRRSYQDGMKVGKILNACRMKKLENALPKPPKVDKRFKGVDLLEARLLNTLCQDPENTLERVYGERVRDQILDMDNSTIGLKELMVQGCHKLGKNYTGFSDVDSMIEFMTIENKKRLNNAAGFSSFDMPNMFKRVTKFVMEESWKIEGIFATDYLYETSNADFKITERFRPSGGDVWDGLDAEGKIKHGSFGKDKRYTTTLDTKAQMLVFNREMIENDDMGAIKEILTLMLEGALIIPDMKLLNHMLSATGGFFKSSGAYVNDYSGAGAALNDTNLNTIYTAAKNQIINKGRVNWVNRLGDMWQLVTGPSLERTAWELLKSGTLIAPTGSTRQGSKNYWDGKLEQVTFNQLANTTINTNAQTDMWFLWPKGQKYAPFALTYLRGKKRPTVETKELPADMLGFAVRGYWDVEVNDREPTAIIRCRPTGSL